MKFQGVKWIYKSPLYVHLKKHFCPECNRELERVKVSKIVNSKSPEADEFDFQAGDTYMIGNVKFIWTEFRCPVCGKQFAIDEMRRIEKKKKSNKNLFD